MNYRKPSYFWSLCLLNCDICSLQNLKSLVLEILFNVKIINLIKFSGIIINVKGEANTFWKAFLNKQQLRYTGYEEIFFLTCYIAGEDTGKYDFYELSLN